MLCIVRSESFLTLSLFVLGSCLARYQPSLRGKAVVAGLPMMAGGKRGGGVVVRVIFVVIAIVAGVGRCMLMDRGVFPSLNQLPSSVVNRKLNPSPHDVYYL